MAFFYKHIVPTGLKRVSTNQVTRTKRRTSGKQYFTKNYLAQLVCNGKFEFVVKPQ